jgi:hypothetical protein
LELNKLWLKSLQQKSNQTLLQGRFEPIIVPVVQVQQEIRFKRRYGSL